MRKPLLSTFSLLLLAFLLGYGGWTLLTGDFRTDPGAPELRRGELELDALPPDFDGMKILLISDLHLSPGADSDWKRQQLPLVSAAAEADLIVLLGDFINRRAPGTAYQESVLSAFLRPLRAPLGVYAVPGNHDYGPGEPQLRRALNAAAIPLLENRSVVIRRNGSSLQLTGLGFPYECHLDWSAALLGRDPELPTIFLSHTPGLFEELPTPGGWLMLSGHTHGGQLRLPLLGSRWLPGPFRLTYDRGLFRRGRQLLYVTSGVGTSNLPLRLNCPPELVLLTLRSGKKRAAEPLSRSAAPTGPAAAGTVPVSR